MEIWVILYVLYKIPSSGSNNQKMISILPKELGRKVEKLKHMKLEVMQPKIENKSKLPARE